MSEEATRNETEATPSATPSAGRDPRLDEMEAVLEAVLFVAGEPVSRERLLGLFDEEDQDAAAAALEAVLARYGGPGSGIMADEAAGGVRLVTRPELHGWLRRFFETGGTARLSMAALETLAIIAYRQPVTSPEIQELRGVSSSGVLRTLLERRLIRISGRKEVVGKPFLYSTSREFLVHFGLKSLGDLPPLEELEETFGDDGMAALAERLGLGFAPGGEAGGGSEDPTEQYERQFELEVAALEEAAPEDPEDEG